MLELQQIKIIRANSSDYLLLTEIAFEAKLFWNYPQSYYELWHKELTITADYINQNLVFKAVNNDLIIGLYSIVENKSDFYAGEVFVPKGFWLEHIFIKPVYHQLGIGRMMIKHVKQVLKNKGIIDLFIFVDPFARGFYDKIGAKYLHDSKSSIPGRLIPVYSIKTD
jgi:GNAT superfamily N-acetyltransferase